MSRFRVAIASGALALAACVSNPPEPGPQGLLDVASRPAERALLAGIRAYDDAQYAEAEKQFGEALRAGLGSSRDRAAAHKHLAFIYCTSNRVYECEIEFRRARAADPSFELTRSESGHPLWGPVYKRTQP